MSKTLSRVLRAGIHVLHDKTGAFGYVIDPAGGYRPRVQWQPNNRIVRTDVDELRRACPDGGTCHHDCAQTHCFRVRTCEPLSGVYPTNKWPGMVVEEFGGPGDEKLEDWIVAEQ